jgi:hypothetical protein
MNSITLTYVYLPHEIVFNREESDFIFWVNVTLDNDNPWEVDA